MQRTKRKICAIICEYNPFHNGHAYLIEEAKKRSECDVVLCVMSGNFVQRGEATTLDKYLRAKHAVLAGADAVLELPAVFATSPAELFAKGAISLLKTIPAVDTLAFGCEQEYDFLTVARAMNDEPKEVSEHIKTVLKSGVSYAKARAEAWRDRFPEDVLRAPNNVLAIEYARAIDEAKANINLLPIKRIGGGYLENEMSENYSSSTAIREAVEQGNFGAISTNVPPFVEKDLIARKNVLERLEKLALLTIPKEEIRRVCDCTEGLENALVNAAKENVSDIVSTCVSKRYTASRIRRVLLQNLLKIDGETVRNALQDGTYLKVLAVREKDTELLRLLGESTLPLLTRGKDSALLTDTAKRVYETETFADEVYRIAVGEVKRKNNPFI